MGGHPTDGQSSTAVKTLMGLQRDSMLEAMSRLSHEITVLVGVLVEEREARDARQGLPDVTPLSGENFASAVAQASAGALREVWEVRPLTDHDGLGHAEPETGGPAAAVTRRVVYASGPAARDGSTPPRATCGVACDHAMYPLECRPLLIVDRTVAILAVDGGTLNGIAINDGPLVALLRSYFEVLWSQSVGCTGVPGVAGGQGERPSPVAVRVLALLSNGYRDDVAARALGLSVRTVRRHVAEVARRLNVRTRFATGFHAHLKGWISAP
jgi:DNA-binding CsgD family transcriptional regulator